jgi:hypothetical protein
MRLLKVEGELRDPFRRSGTLRSKSTDTTPIVSSLTVIAKGSVFVRRSDHTATPAVGTQRFRNTLAVGGQLPASAILKFRRQKRSGNSCGNLELTLGPPLPSAPGLDFAAQSAPDELGKADLLVPGFLSQAGLGLPREAERYGYTALGQFRSGHLPSVLLCHTHCQGRISLRF